MSESQQRQKTFFSPGCSSTVVTTLGEERSIFSFTFLPSCGVLWWGWVVDWLGETGGGCEYGGFGTGLWVQFVSWLIDG